MEEWDAEEVERQLEKELVARLLAVGFPAPLAAAFEGLEPKWAVAACGRLILTGVISESVDGTLTVVHAVKRAA